MYTDLLLISKKTKEIICFKKPKAMLLAFGFCLLIFSFHSQVNYVQNPSFEVLDSCKFNINFIYPPKYWDTLRAGGGGGPEISSTCSNWPGLKVPYTGFASFQIPKSGNNYCYYTVFNPNPAVGERREYIQNELRQSLKVKSYCVTYNISLMNESLYAITEFGAYFDTGIIYTSYFGTSTVTPQVKSPVGVYVNDTLNWVKIQGIFTASGNERYITLGNFKANGTTNFSIVPGFSQRNVSDYYIDDVSVIESDLPAFAGRDTVLCLGDSVFIGRPQEVGLECIWNTGTINIGSGGGLWVKPSSTQTFMVTQDVCGLIKKDTIQVQVKPKYTGTPINITSNVLWACPENTIVLTATNNPPGASNKYQWLPLAVYTQTSISGASAMLPQTTTLTLNVTNNGADAFCPFQQTSSVAVWVPVFTGTITLTGNSIIVCPDNKVNLSISNFVAGGTVSVQWLPKPAFTFTNNNSAISLINQTLTYTVNITTTSGSSICAFTRTLTLEVTVPDTCFKDPEIPNIFTPNNDNANDVWGIKFPKGYSLQNLELYNRWGTLIYKRSNLSFEKQNSALIAWDGYTTSGEPCSVGVYFYVLNYTDKSGEAKVAKGNVTLLR